MYSFFEKKKQNDMTENIKVYKRTALKYLESTSCKIKQVLLQKYHENFDSFIDFYKKNNSNHISFN